MSMMNDIGRRVNSILVKNLPLDYNENQLEALFSKFGRITSVKVLPSNPNFEGSCGFVNYAENESCAQAVENMDNFVIGRFTIRVNHSSTRIANNNSDRPQNGFRANGELDGRTISATSISQDENNGISSPSTHTRFSGFRPASERSPSTSQLKPMSMNTKQLSANELDNKPLWNSNASQQTSNSKSSFQNEISPVNQQMDIQEHEVFVINKVYNVYLSNLEVPNVIFAATLDDYVNATLLITQMNKHEQLAKVQANSYKSKLVIGQTCAALFNGDWYRARVLETGENRVRVQYIDWGNTGWCDSILEIRPLPNEYYKDPALCVKCILDGIPSNEKLSDEQTNNILSILVLDLKLEMTVLRIENSLPCVRLNIGERNLNNEIRAVFPSFSTSIKQNQIMNFDSNKPEINQTEIHYVQLTTVDAESECFHVLLMRDCLATIMNVLKDWNVNKQSLAIQPKANMLVCAQYDADDLWYRAWIQSVTENGYRVYFVDFGNEENVSIDRLSDCPDTLKTIPWQSLQIKLANIKLTDDERYSLLKDFETDRLEMKIIQKNQDIYHVDLMDNGKSLIEHILELRKKKQEPRNIPVNNEVPKVPTEPVQQPPTPRASNEDVRPVSLPVQPIVDTPKRSTEPNNIKMFQSTTTAATVDTAKKPSNTLDIVTKQLPVNEQNNDSAVNENLASLLTEQRRQNRLLEQVIAAINTTNALLTQLVQR